MTKGHNEIRLNERAQYLFRVLVERYIADGQPVGSRTLARDSRLDLSPATIRNVMADLEDLGLIRAPHTSAGRVPTALGYRLFVDSLVTFRGLSADDVRRMESSLTGEDDIQALLGSTSRMLSEITRLAGLVMIPVVERRALRQVEFLSLNDNRVLAILVTNDREVENRIVKTNRAYSQSELTQAANYLNSAFAGRDIEAVKQRLIQEMADTRAEMDQLMALVIEMSQQLFGDGERPKDYVLAGETNLMDKTELSDIEKLRSLFEAFNQKRDILHLLDQALNASGVQIFIGEESGYEVLDQCSIVTSPYTDDNRTLGVLGVIGPTRMEYERVIPIVDLTAKMLSMALNSRN
ncbi:MAG: heat-inducible transcriptional repressor HrcA [Gammaproteobacteria bacterium]|nr:heat-inducible transcriptional repressor HrcA [Gammaproteobacteria bacterium]MCP5201647.1 heat-inducible transcriptional repressor HrcA [Gammaproteobacteria bacterium]